ncbi:spore germination protein [hydrocarbon metagenome]|uniref:Spore germination protein n=1 Tax=hydrocarbon metagenome TaxID=938273 RepID=A0A0W8E5F6_9ZZZZ
MTRHKFRVLILSSILILGLLITGCTPSDQTGDPDNNQPPAATEQELTLYFAEAGANGLVAEKRTIEVEDPGQLSSLIVQELIAGPVNDSLYPTIPPETKLISVKLEAGTAMVDFSQEIISKHWGGSTGETMTIMSLVNSLTELSEVERVQILVEGEVVDSLLGHWDSSEPIERDESLILRPQS